MVVVVMLKVIVVMRMIQMLMIVISVMIVIIAIMQPFEIARRNRQILAHHGETNQTEITITHQMPLLVFAGPNSRR